MRWPVEVSMIRSHLSTPLHEVRHQVSKIFGEKRIMDLENSKHKGPAVKEVSWAWAERQGGVWSGGRVEGSRAGGRSRSDHSRWVRSGAGTHGQGGVQASLSSE